MMTVVNFDFADPAGVPVKGYVSLVPTRRVTVGDEVRLPTALRVRLEAGEASVELMPSTTQWVWRVAELVPGGITRYVAVPDSELVEYADLESVDPSSLDVSSASVPAWEIATRTAQETLDKVGEIDGKVERAEDAAAGAESSASEAEAHENAAKSSADAAASSASDAASSAVSAASSASAAESSASGAASSAGEAGVSAEAAAGSAAAAALSASDAAAHAESAGSSADAAAVSATSAADSVSAASSYATSAADSVSAASSYATSASQSASEAAKSVADAAGSVSVAASHANAAAQSASEASASAQAAKASETNAVSSASAAKTSETNAAASATAAQQAVEGFGLEVGTTTTGDPGTDAAVEIQKTSTKYTANFTIPRGDVGPAGVNENVPLGTASGMVAQASDAYPALPRKVQVHGRTIENLCPVFNEANNHGVSFSTDSDGYITIKGTSTAAIYAQHPIINFQSNTKVWIYVDSNVKAKGINDVYAQSSGWSLYADSNKAMSSTTPSNADGATMVISIASGVTVDVKIRVMFVASETEPDTSLFVPSGVNTVKPTELVAAGKNLYDESYANLDPYWGRGEFDENGDLLIYSNADAINRYAALPIVKNSHQFPEGEYVVSALIPNIPDSRLNVYNGTDKNYALQVSNKYPSVTSGKVTINPEKQYSVNIEFASGTGTTEAAKISDIQIERGTVKTSYSKPKTTFTNLPSGISLADGDTLTIDRDGTTQIVHAEGEPTVLENVTLPELHAPTFNVYTTGGYIQPTVDVDYERDVSLVLEALEAKIAALEVNQTIMKQGA